MSEEGNINLLRILCLQAIRGVGPKTICSILDSSVGLDGIFERPEVLHDLKIRNKPEICTALQESSLKTLMESATSQLENCSKLGIQALSISDDLYPPQLKRLDSPPIILYVQGDISLLKSKSVAIIGTRKASELGLKINTITTEHFCQENFPIVSGLALGHDIHSHKITLEMGGKAIAVLASLDQISPSAHVPFATKILEREGVLVSENPPERRVSNSDFIKRDRIQAGLSQAVFAIETTLDGGSMHAIHASAKYQGKVYVPDFRPYVEKNFFGKLTPEIDGILELIKNNEAKPYTKDHLPMISQALREDN